MSKSRIKYLVKLYRYYEKGLCTYNEVIRLIGRGGVYGKVSQ